ncbi:MAG: riboflavin synthase [Helicobacteraceae bacterium]|nr:riboflavin synthase [Helicobacteraceae bacterium]
MFSGLVKVLGEVVDLKDDIITIKSVLSPKIGASIAVNGICLTAMDFKNDKFSAALSKESRDNIALENLCGKVHLEEALAFGDRFDGHIVQGHIDSIGVIEDIRQNQNGFDFYIKYDKNIKNLLIPKGSICIDGISLTINEVLDSIFRLTIIPHTYNNTLFHQYKPKRRVNIETDIIARSLFHFISNKRQGENGWREIDSILASY